MKEPLDMVDEHIDTFIQTGRRRWDVGHFIFYRDPIYDIEGGSRAKGIELSSPEIGPHLHMIQILGSPMMI
jgi:hypothetical protein